MLELILMVVALLGIVAIMALLALKGKWTSLRMMAYGLMLAAERHVGTTGAEKMNAVLSAFYEMLPAFIQRYVDAVAFRSLLQGWYDNAKDFLDDSSINGSILDSSNKPPG